MLSRKPAPPEFNGSRATAGINKQKRRDPKSQRKQGAIWPLLVLGFLVIAHPGHESDSE